MDNIDTKPKNTGTPSVIKLTSSREAKSRQHKAVAALLSVEEEYHDLESYIPVEDALVETISKDIVLPESEQKDAIKVNPRNVMRVLQYDIMGYSNVKIGAELGLTENTVRRIKKTEAYISAREQLISSVVEGTRKYLEVASLKALKTLLDSLDSSNPRVRLSAAQDILDRAGLSAPKHIEIKDATMESFGNYTEEDLLEILKKDKIVPKGAEVLDVDTSEKPSE